MFSRHSPDVFNRVEDSCRRLQVNGHDEFCPGMGADCRVNHRSGNRHAQLRPHLDDPRAIRCRLIPHPFSERAIGRNDHLVSGGYERRGADFIGHASRARKDVDAAVAAQAEERFQLLNAGVVCADGLFSVMRDRDRSHTVQHRCAYLNRARNHQGQRLHLSSSDDRYPSATLGNLTRFVIHQLFHLIFLLSRLMFQYCA